MTISSKANNEKKERETCSDPNQSQFMRINWVCRIRTSWYQHERIVHHPKGRKDFLLVHIVLHCSLSVRQAPSWNRLRSFRYSPIATDQLMFVFSSR